MRGDIGESFLDVQYQLPNLARGKSWDGCQIWECVAQPRSCSTLCRTHINVNGTRIGNAGIPLACLDYWSERGISSHCIHPIHNTDTSTLQKIIMSSNNLTIISLIRKIIYYGNSPQKSCTSGFWWRLIKLGLASCSSSACNSVNKNGPIWLCSIMSRITDVILVGSTCSSFKAVRSQGQFHISESVESIAAAITSLNVMMIFWSCSKKWWNLRQRVEEWCAGSFFIVLPWNQHWSVSDCFFFFFFFPGIWHWRHAWT